MIKSSNTLEKDRILYINGLSLILLTTISGLVLSSPIPSAHADDTSVSTATVTVTQSCSMTATTDTPHTANLHNGIYSGADYENGIGKTTLKTFCNDGLGYAIYAIGYTGNEYGSTVLHSDTLGSNFDINTGIYTSGFTVNSTWSMKLSSVSGAYAPTITDGTNNTENFTTWHVIPDEYTKVAYRTTGTDMLVNNIGTGSSVEVTYDAYISATQPAGTYVGQVKYTLVHPSTAGKPPAPLKDSDCPAGNVCYAPNASDIVGSMSSLGSITSSSKAGKISVGTSATTINLIAPNYKRPGYGFAGWSTDFTATNASTIYGPNETLTVPSTTLATKGMILYPVWIASTGTLQGTNNQGWTGCSSLTTAPSDGTRATLASMTALTDTRDGNVYTVARLADGKCWMTENLRLNNEATISTSNTHSPLNTNGTVTLKIDYANNTIADHLASTSDSWCTSNNAACDDQTMLNTNNTRLSDSSLTASYSANNAASKWYSYGNYYNWYSATAGNGTYSFKTNNNSVTGDLCPAGWHLPKGGNKNNTANSEFWALSLAIVGAEPANTSSNATPYYTGTPEGDNASNTFRAYPNNFVYSGYWDGAQANRRSGGGYYWSSSAGDYDYAYNLYFYSSIVSPGASNGYKYYGRSVRCVAGS